MPKGKRRPIIRRAKTHKLKKSIYDWHDMDFRLSCAKARDNGGTWWLCASEKTTAHLERQFRLQQVAVVLLESIGGILGSPQFNKQKFVYLQVDSNLDRTTMSHVTLCLDELGVRLIRPIEADRMINA